MTNYVAKRNMLIEGSDARSEAKPLAGISVQMGLGFGVGEEGTITRNEMSRRSGIPLHMAFASCEDRPYSRIFTYCAK